MNRLISLLFAIALILIAVGTTDAYDSDIKGKYQVVDQDSDSGISIDFEVSQILSLNGVNFSAGEDGLASDFVLLGHETLNMGIEDHEVSLIFYGFTRGRSRAPPNLALKKSVIIS